MSRAAWPTAAELKTALQASGVLPDGSVPDIDSFDLAGFAAAASDEFMHRTKLEPFLVEASDSTRRYDPSGPSYRDRWSFVGGGKLLTFGAPYQSITSVTINDDPAVGTDGLELVVNEQYFLEPPNRIENTQITGIRFRAAVLGIRRSVVVVGKVGYYTAIPESIWQAVLSGAMAMMLQHFRESIISEPTDWREGDSAEKYNVETLLKLGNSHQARFDSAVSDHEVILL